MKKRFTAQLTAFAMAVSILPIPGASAQEISANNYGASDGVSISEISKGNVYYGQMKHALQVNGADFFYYGDVTKREETPTPILWQAMGEEVDAENNGDGKLALFSKYILDSYTFPSENSTVNSDYTNSKVSQWLNNETDGFLTSFTAAENSVISPSEVVVEKYNASNAYDGTETVTQKVYLPWATEGSVTENYPSLYWSAGNTEGKNLAADKDEEQPAALKGLNMEMFYWTRTPSNSTSQYIVRRKSDKTSAYPRAIVSGQTISTNSYGVRPVTKLDVNDIVFASKIVSQPSSYDETAAIAPHLAAGDELTPNYKLTVLGNDGEKNPYSMNVSNYTENSIIPVTMGDDINFNIDSISDYGEDYTINYKAVMTINGKRMIVTGGSTESLTSDTAEITVSSSDFLRTEAETDSVDVYIWLQKNNDYVSNEASDPVHFEIALTGGEPSVIPTPEPDPLPEDVRNTIKTSYPDGKMKAVILSFDDLADYHYLSDKHLVDILNENGLKTAFNVITSLVADGGIVRQHLSEFDGHEIASHSVTHPQFDELSKDELIGELNDSAAFLEELTGGEVAGLAYPYYYSADTEELQYVKDAGYRYSRRTDRTNTFDIPDSFYNWNPTMWVLDKNDSDEYALPLKAQELIDLDADEEQMLFVWGHSTDFGGFTPGESNYEGNTWYVMEDFCNRISDNLDTIWNPTVIDFVDYINSQKLLGIYQGSGNNILFDNTKGTKDTWVTVSGVPVMIQAGQTLEVDPSDLDIPAPTPTTEPVVTEAPTQSPTQSPTQAPTTAPTQSPTQAPVVTAAPQAPEVLMICDFEGDAALPVTSAGTASAGKVSSPLGNSYKKLPAAAKNDEESIASNLEEIEKIKEEASKNTVLKLSQAAANDTNTVTLYEGKLPKDFALDFSVMGIGSFSDFTIDVIQDGVTYNLLKYNRWVQIFLAGSTQRYDYYFTDMWIPHTMIFEDFASDNTNLTMYLSGRLNYTGKASNPQDYTNTYKDLGAYYSGLDLSKDVRIEIKSSGLSTSNTPIDIYFDNIRLYKYDNTISNEAGNDFDSNTISMAPAQNGIRTGGRAERQTYYADASTKLNYGLWSYETSVEEDPLDPSNKVLKLRRGEGSNEYMFDGAVRFTVNKPQKQLTIKFKALTSDIGNSPYNIAVDIADGIFRDVFFQTESNSPADRIFTFNHLAQGQFVSSGRYNGKYAADYNWGLNEWNDVTIIYDVENNKTSFDINGITFDVIPNPNSEIISQIMASDEEQITVNIYRPYSSEGAYIMLDDISIVSDDGNGGAQEPSPSPTQEPEPSVSPSPSTEPTPTQEPEETTAPTEEPGFSGEWKSEYYPSGTGYNDTLQYPVYVKDLGEAQVINKITLDHDSMDIMSYCVSISENGEDYTAVTPVFAGGIEKNSNKQVYRFNAQNVRYIKYSPVLLGESETQARVNSITYSNTNTVSMVFNDLPDTVNPVYERVDLALSVKVTDSDGDTYDVREYGAAYELTSGAQDGGVSLSKNTLTITRDAVSGTVTVTAKDLSNDTTAVKTIKVSPKAAVQNVGLYADESGTQDISALTPGSTVYLKLQAMTSEALGTVNAKAVFALYNADGTLENIGVNNIDIASSESYEDITASYTLPQTISENMYIKVYIWDDTEYPLSSPVIYSDNEQINGFKDANIFLNKSETANIRLAKTAENVVWESSDSSVALVENGTVTGNGDGTAVITATVNGEVIASVQVSVKPVYVFLCMGQSNMSAMTNSASTEKEPFEVPVSEGVLLLNGDNEFEQASHSYGRYTQVALTGGSPDFGQYMIDRVNMTYSFAEDFKKDHPGTEIGLIVNSKVGCNIDVFQKGSTTGNGFENSVSRAHSDEVQEKGELKGILWHQGENNSADLNYTYVFKNLMYDFRTALGNLELPVIAGGLAEDKPLSGNTSGAIAFNDRLSAQTANLADFGFASSRYPYVLTVNATDSTDANRMKDESHFSAKSQVEFGHRYYDAYLNIANK